MEIPELLQEIWAKLVRGGADRKHDFHFPVLGTAHPSRGCSLRTVVLRKVVPAERMLICYTDRRSPKISEIAQNSAAEWLFYHKASMEQIRANGRISIHHNDQVAAMHWQRVPDEGKKDYTSAQPPGSLKAIERGGEVDPIEHFTVMACIIDRLDWLQLGRQGHQRAILEWKGEEWQGHWVNP